MKQDFPYKPPAAEPSNPAEKQDAGRRPAGQRSPPPPVVSPRSYLGRFSRRDTCLRRRTDRIDTHGLLLHIPRKPLFRGPGGRGESRRRRGVERWCWPRRNLWRRAGSGLCASARKILCPRMVVSRLLGEGHKGVAKRTVKVGFIYCCQNPQIFKHI